MTPATSTINPTARHEILIQIDHTPTRIIRLDNAAVFALPPSKNICTNHAIKTRAIPILAIFLVIFRIFRKRLSRCKNSPYTIPLVISFPASVASNIHDHDITFIAASTIVVTSASVAVSFCAKTLSGKNTKNSNQTLRMISVSMDDETHNE